MRVCAYITRVRARRPGEKEKKRPTSSTTKETEAARRRAGGLTGEMDVIRGEHRRDHLGRLFVAAKRHGCA